MNFFCWIYTKYLAGEKIHTPSPYPQGTDWPWHYFCFCLTLLEVYLNRIFRKRSVCCAREQYPTKQEQHRLFIIKVILTRWDYLVSGLWRQKKKKKTTKTSWLVTSSCFPLSVNSPRWPMADSGTTAPLQTQKGSAVGLWVLSVGTCHKSHTWLPWEA